MLTLLSPAKSFDFESPAHTDDISQPYFTTEPQRLIRKMRTLSRKKLSELMNISPELASVNATRYQQWSSAPQEESGKQAILAFNGEVYRGLNAKGMTAEDLQFAQNHLRILSGLYGVLKPLDIIQPYRLEMGTRLKYYSYDNLYQFWGDKITKHLNESMSGIRLVINLASTEYYKSVKESKLNARVITPIFKDFSNGTYKVLMTYAKNARGAMAQYIIKNQIDDAELIKGFDINGYAYDPSQSDENNWVFIRG